MDENTPHGDVHDRAARRHNPEDHLMHTVRSLTQWTISETIYQGPPEPHKVVFWSSTWGINITRLVWQFCQELRWPCPMVPRNKDDSGITWVELAMSFMLWSQRYPPIKIKSDKVWHAYDVTDTKVQMLPLKNRSLRVVSESFRYIVKHIQTFSNTKVIPTYTQQGATSLTRLGFAVDQRCGISRRPYLPNANDVYKWMHEIVLTMPNNPPYHTDIELPAIPSHPNRPTWPDWPEITLSKREQFSRQVRNHMARKKSLDLILWPEPN